MLMTTETLGKRLRRLRRAADMTQRQLAERAGVNLGSLRNWEQGTRQPLADAIVKLAKALNVTTDQLLGMNEE